MLSEVQSEVFGELGVYTKSSETLTTYSGAGALRKRLLDYFLLLVLFLIFFGFVSVSYLAGLVFLFGMILSWLLLIFVQAVSIYGRTREGRRLLPIILASILSLIAIGLYLQDRQNVGGGGGGGGFPPFIESYRVIVKPIDQRRGLFGIEEEAVITSFYLDEDEYKIKHYVKRSPISGTRLGLVLQEVRISPLDADSSGIVTLVVSDTTTEVFLGAPLQDAEVELRDVPRGSFYEARYAKNIEQHPYVDTETITWETQELHQGITFTYIPYPLNYARPILAPFAGVYALGDKSFRFASAVTALVLFPILRFFLKKRLRLIFEWEKKIRSSCISFLLSSVFGVRPASIVRCRLIVEPIDKSLEVFKVFREVHLNFSADIGGVLYFPEEEISSGVSGPLFREVYIEPVDERIIRRIREALPDGVSIGNAPIQAKCEVELRNMPRNTFRGGRDAESMGTFPYIDTETIIWTVRNIKSGVAFAYLPPRLRDGESGSQMFLWKRTFPGFILWIIGALIGVIVGLQIRPKS